MILDNDEQNISGGMLIDWDLSKALDPPDKPNAARRCTRTVSRASEALYFLTPDVYFHQGTWQFMAADLVRDPNIAQTFEHDLESVFWVLFWMTLLYVDNEYPVPMRSSYIIQTMNPRTFGDSGSGGSDKFNFMASPMALMDLATPGCPLANLLKEMHKELRKRYLYIPPSVASTSAAVPNSTENVTDGSTQQEAIQEDKHAQILNLLERALNQKWPDSDSAELQEVVLSNNDMRAVRVGTKKSRAIAEMNGASLPQPEAKRSKGP